MSNSEYNKAQKFKYIHDGLTEEQIKQRCRFLDISYVKGNYQFQRGFSQYKKWYHDNFVKNENIEKRKI